MTPIAAQQSYKNTLKIAQSNGDSMIVDDLNYRIALMDRFPFDTINVQKFTCKNTHGDLGFAGSGTPHNNGFTRWVAKKVIKKVI